MKINIGNWDAQTRRDFDSAMDLASRFWQSIGEDKTLRINPGPPEQLVFRYNGVDRNVGLQTGGILFNAVDIFTNPAAVSFNCKIRFRPRPTSTDPAATTDARNALFLWPGGRRRSVPELTGMLVHEITHKQQQINSFLGNFSFALVYILTLGVFDEREADRMENKAIRFADLALGAGGTTIIIVGPGELIEGQSAGYTAVVMGPPPGWLPVGPPPMPVPVVGGVYDWDPRPGQGRDGIRATAAGNNTITIKAEDDEGTAVLNLTFRNGPVTAVQSFSIRLRGEE